MARVSKTDVNTKKWSAMFDGEEMVDLFIPVDKMNPDKQKFLCINGEQIWLAVGQPLKVPKSVADLWNYSYSNTYAAEQRMSQEIEIKV